jgi:hypothetical protein
MWKRISETIKKFRAAMENTEKEEVTTIEINTIVDVMIPNTQDSSKLQKFSLLEIQDSLLTKQRNLRYNDFYSKFVVDMGLEEGSKTVYLFEISVQTRYKEDAYYQTRKQLMHTIRKKFNSPTDVAVLEFYHGLISILPKK